MLNDLFRVLRNALIDHMRLYSGLQSTEPTQEPVVFCGAEKVENANLKLGAVTMMLVNLEEDRKAMPPDPYRRVVSPNTKLNVNPPIAMNVYVLFVARCNDYLDGLGHIDAVVKFFQKHRSVDATSMPALAGTNIDKVVCELVTFPLAELNQIWGPMNAAYHPSLVYRFRTVLYEDAAVVPAAPPIGETVFGYASLGNPTSKVDALGQPEVARQTRSLVDASSSNGGSAPVARSTVTDTYSAANLVGSGTADDTIVAFSSPDEVPAATNVSSGPMPMRWAYYCVTDAKNAKKHLKIEDKDPQAKLTFASRNLTSAPDDSDALGKYLASRHPGKSVMRFVSSVVPESDEPRRHIELRFDSDVLSRPLANPSAKSLARINLSLDADAPNPCNVLTHVIEYRTQPTQTTM